MPLYLVHDAKWDTSLEGALGSYANLIGRAYDPETHALGASERFERIRAPLLITSKAGRTPDTLSSAMIEMRARIEHELKTYLERTPSEDNAFIAREYLEGGLERPHLESHPHRTRTGQEVYRAWIPYPTIRELELTKDETLKPLKKDFRVANFTPAATLRSYLGGAYPIVEIEDGIARPTGRSSLNALRAAGILAADIETYDSEFARRKHARIPDDAREHVLERVEAADRAWLETASDAVIHETYLELTRESDRRIIMAQLKGPRGTWVGTTLQASDAARDPGETQPFHEVRVDTYGTLAPLITEHRKRADETPIIAGHNLGSDLENWREAGAEPFNAQIRTPAKIRQHRSRFSLDARIALETDLHAEHFWPSLRSHDLDAVVEHVLGAPPNPVSPAKRRSLIEEGLDGDVGSIEHLISYGLDDVHNAFDLAHAMWDDVAFRAILHDTSIERLAGMSERAISERFYDRHHERYGKRPATDPRHGKRRFGTRNIGWDSFTLAKRYERLFTEGNTEGLGDVTILRLHPFQHALEELLTELPTIGDAYAQARSGKRWLFSDLERMSAYLVFLLEGSRPNDTQQAAQDFETAFHHRDSNALHTRIENVEARMRNAFSELQVVGSSGDLIAIVSDERSRALEDAQLASSVAKGQGFVARGAGGAYVLVEDRGVHAVGTVKIAGTGHGDYGSEEREAIGVFEDGLLANDPFGALESLVNVSLAIDGPIERTDVAKRFSHEYQPNANTTRINAHREARSRPGDLVTHTRLEGLWENDRIVGALRAAFEGLHGSHGLGLIKNYLQGDAYARAMVESNVKRFGRSDL